MEINDQTLISRANVKRWLGLSHIPKHPEFPAPIRRKLRYYWTTKAIRDYLDSRELFFGEHVPEIPPDLPAYQPQEGPIESGQAKRIVARFGGAYKLAAVLRRINRPYSVVTIYQWTYGRGKGGRGGRIPPRALQDVQLAAMAEKIVLTPEELAV